MTRPNFKIPFRLITVLMALISLALFFIPSPVNDESIWIGRLWDLGHVAMFMAWNLIAIRSLLTAGISTHRIIPTLLLATIVIGGLIELIQMQFGRQSSWHDLAFDVAGCIFAITSAPLRRLRILLVPAALFTAYPLASIAVDRVIARQQFPVLLDNSTPFELTRLSGKALASRSSSNFPEEKNAIAIQFGIDQYSVLKLTHFPGDWSQYHMLLLDFYIPDNNTLPINFTLADVSNSGAERNYYDSFHTQFTLLPGANHIAISLNTVATTLKSRTIDLRHMEKMTIYTMDLPTPRKLLINSIRLTKNE